MTTDDLPPLPESAAYYSSNQFFYSADQMHAYARAAIAAAAPAQPEFEPLHRPDGTTFIDDLVAAPAQPAISTEHGPWLPSQHHADETYCQRCLCRSIFAGAKKCEPHIAPAQPAPQPLSDGEIDAAIIKEMGPWMEDPKDLVLYRQIARAVLADQGEKHE